MKKYCWLSLFIFFAYANYAFPWGKNSEDPMRLGKNVFPVSQAINLVVDADRDTYSGSVSMKLKVVERTSSFRFHAEDINIEKISLSGDSGLMEISHNIGQKGTVTVKTGRALSPGDYSLVIHFSNDFNRKAVSFYKTETEGAAYTFTQFESEYARQAFPCWDEPGFKIPWQVTLTVPEGHVAISNTPALMVEVKDGRKTVIFKKTPPMPAYLVVIATGPLEALPVEGMSVPGKIYTVKERSHLAAELAKMSGPILKALEDYFGAPYPYEKLDQLAVPEFLWGAMENVGAIVYRDSIVLLDEKSATFNQRKSLAGIMAHEMAHMWFGNLVTTKWWSDIWLNESFASWMGQKITDSVYPDFQLSIANVAYGQTAMRVDALPSTPPIRRQHLASDDPSKMFDSLSYNKGMAVLGMVEQWMGADKFREGMRDYMKTYAWGNASADDLWSTLARHTESDLTALMGSFIDQPGVPLVSAEILPDNRLRLAQKRIINYGLEMPAANLWQIPVTIRYWDGYQEHTKKLLLKEAVQTFDLPAKSKILWLHPNVGEKGYYRWQVQPGVLKTLASNSAKVLGLRERVGFIDNLSALFKAGNLHGSSYLRTLGYFAGDPSPEVLKALAGAINDLKLTFVTKEMEEGYRTYLRTTLRPALDRIGLERKEGEDEVISSLRSTLVGRLGGVGRDPEVMEYVRALSQKYIENPDSVDPSLAGAALAAAAYHGDAPLFQRIKKKFETVETPVERSRYLAALGSFRKPEMVEKALRYALTADFRPHESIAIPTSLAGDPQLQPMVFSWMMEHYETIIKRTPPHYLGRLPTLVDGRDLQLLEEARQFFSSHHRMTPLIEKKLIEISDMVRHRASLKEKESGSIQEFLSDSIADNDSTKTVKKGV